MANNDSISAGTIMVAFAIGALTGAAVALLFAPASGEETREYLGQKAREGRARALEAGQGLTTAIERGREAFKESRERGGQPA